MLRTESTAVHETYLALAAAAAACAINFWARDLGHCSRFTTGSSIADKSAAPAPEERKCSRGQSQGFYFVVLGAAGTPQCRTLLTVRSLTHHTGEICHSLSQSKREVKL